MECVLLQCRVVVAPGVHRFSCAYFTVPSWNAWVQPLPPAAAAPPPPTALSDLEAGSTTPAGSSGDAAVKASAETASSGSAGAANPAAEPVQQGNDGLACEPASGVLVTAHGCSLAPGASGVRVIDYIQAKYKFHFQDAGKTLDKQ